MKRVLFLFLAFLAAVSQSYAFIDSYTIDRDKLPDAAKEMLDEYFPKAKVSMIKVDRHLLKKTDYDVKLVNGTKIEFNNSGKWTSVDCKTREVPDGIIMKPILKYVNKNFPQTFITKISKKGWGYELPDDYLYSSQDFI